VGIDSETLLCYTIDSKQENKMTQTMKQLKAKHRRENTKTIETALHPEKAVLINGYEICHRHMTNGQIEFTALKNDVPVSKWFKVYRDHVLSLVESGQGFYTYHASDLYWLASQTDEEYYALGGT
jgi:hypothetical protein